MDLDRLQPKRIVIIKPSALGDIMHSLPVLRALRERFPQAHLAWVVNRMYEPLLRHDPDLNNIVCWDRKAGVFQFGTFLRQLRQQRYDLAIDLQGLLRTGIMTFATGAKTRLGLASAREGARYFYTHRVQDGFGQTHAVDRYWKIIEALGADASPKRFDLVVDPEAQAWARQQLLGLPRPWMAIGVGARWLTKRWPPAHFAKVVGQAVREFGGSAIFVGAPDEAPLAEEAASLLPAPSLQMTGKTSLPQLAAVLGEVDLMLGNDTGPLHLAVALGRPVVAPYTCTLDRRTGPYGSAHRVVETKVWCAGSYVRQCSRLECMAELSPDRLWPALREVLVTWHRQRQSA